MKEEIGWWVRIRDELFDVRRGEWPVALGLSGFFFIVIAAFWVVKPIKRGLFLSAYQGTDVVLWGWSFEPAELEQIGKVVNLFGAFLAVAVLTAVLRRFRRVTVVSGIALGSAALFGVFALFIGTPSRPLAWAIYVFGDLFNTMMVGVFWAFAADLLRPEQAKRLYGIVGLGGVLGGFVGASVVAGAVDVIGRAPLLVAGGVAVSTLALLARWVDGRASAEGANQGDALESDGAAALEGARLVTKSPYLLGVMALVALYEMVSNIIDFQLSAMVQLEVQAGTEKDAFFGLVGQLTGIVSIVVQLFATSWVMRRFGIGIALLILPVAVLGGSLGFLFLPSLAVAAVMSASDNSLHYSINQSAKEALYVPLTRDEKYKAKAFIDMFVQRLAKVAAVVLNLAVAALVGLEDVHWLSLAAIVALVAWMSLARFLGRSFDHAAKQVARGEVSRS